MSLITGSNGEFRYRGLRIAKCRDFSIDVSRDALDSSTLGSFDREYVEGMRGATGSATVLYDDEDPGTTELINSIFRSGKGGQEFSAVLNTNTNKSLSFKAFTTQVSVPVRVGEVTACSLNFQVTGPVEGAF